MSKSIITVEGLGKAYRLGQKLEQWSSFYDVLTGFVRSPFKKLRQKSNAAASDEAFWAIRDINFEVAPGEVIGLIGRNGAGKSTLLKVLSRIVEPSEGRAHIRGRVASLLEVGTGFHPELSGRENIYLNGAILGMKRTEITRKFDAIVDFAEVEKFLDTPVKRYSSGMYVRLAFAVAAHLEPEILIVDEVLAVGDASFQKKCMGKMGDVVKDGRTILFVSHNMDAVLQLCSHVVLLKNGRNTERLSPDEGVKQYLAMSNEGTSLPLAEKPRTQFRPHMPIFTGLSIVGASGHRNVCESNGKVNFDIELSHTLELPGDLTCGVAISNERSQRIAFFHSHYQSGMSFRGTDGRVRLSCNVPSLPLVPGRYFVELVLSDGYQVIEKVERAEAIDVVFADVFGTGKIPKSSQGYLVLPCEWTHEPIDEIGLVQKAI